MKGGAQRLKRIQEAHLPHGAQKGRATQREQREHKTTINRSKGISEAEKRCVWGFEKAFLMQISINKDP